MSSSLRLAIVGATGAVGRETVSVLEERNFEFADLKLLASKRSAGESISFKNKEFIVQELNEDSFKDVDIALFCAGSSVSEKFASHAVKSGAIVIDKTSAFRMDKDVPLIVPEVNLDVLNDAVTSKEDGKGLIISNPNCSTIPLTCVLSPLEKKFGLKRVVVSTYQSVSGAGKEGMAELWEQTKGVFNQTEVPPKTFQHKIAFNCIPHIDSFTESGYTKEEIKLMEETKKIMKLPELLITATAVRVPVMSCHSESVNIEFNKEAAPEEIKALLSESDGVVLEDKPDENTYPLNSTVMGTDETYVGRVRKDSTLKHGASFWLVCDNLRKGAALNGVQIAEKVAELI